MLKSIFGEEIVYEVSDGGFEVLADNFFEEKAKEEKAITTIISRSNNVVAIPSSIRLLSKTLNRN